MNRNYGVRGQVSLVVLKSRVQLAYFLTPDPEPLTPVLL